MQNYPTSSLPLSLFSSHLQMQTDVRKFFGLTNCRYSLGSLQGRVTPTSILFNYPSVLHKKGRKKAELDKGQTAREKKERGNKKDKQHGKEVYSKQICSQRARKGDSLTEVCKCYCLISVTDIIRSLLPPKKAYQIWQQESIFGEVQYLLSLGSDQLTEMDTELLAMFGCLGKQS